MGPFQMLRNSLQLARDATGKQSPLNARSWPKAEYWLPSTLTPVPWGNRL